MPRLILHAAAIDGPLNCCDFLSAFCVGEREGDAEDAPVRGLRTVRTDLWIIRGVSWSITPVQLPVLAHSHSFPCGNVLTLRVLGHMKSAQLPSSSPSPRPPSRRPVECHIFAQRPTRHHSHYRRSAALDLPRYRNSLFSRFLDMQASSVAHSGAPPVPRIAHVARCRKLSRALSVDAGRDRA
ncbi:hypothetical protein OH77DRAFT_1428702 [Trametes cingulata]|nr:hypothetical protein OH77DRAFT_1428702 [Trametes cingulata]